jgi:OOP family OmpA-OmpF porin
MVAMVVFMAVSSNVQADEEGEPFIRPGAFTVSPMIGGYMFDSSQDIEEGPVFGLGLGYNFTENWAVRLYGHFGEFSHPYWDIDTCGCIEEDVDASVLQADLIYHLWPDSRFVPYLAAGAGYMDLDFDNTGEDSSTTLNYGGGIKYFLTRNLALKANVRHIYWLDDSKSNMMANVGLEFQFGGSKQEPVVTPAVQEPEPPPTPAPVEKPAKPEPKVAPPIVIPEPETLVLRINFKFDDATVEQAYHDEIEKAVQFLNRHPGVDATIEGHTCSMGPESYNMGLSRKRAESVKSYMIRNFDVDGTRLSTTGYGESRPEHDNATLEGKRLNRRVVIRLEEE